MDKSQIIVTGDIALDNNIYKGQRNSPEDMGYGTQIIEKEGGSYHLYKIIQNIVIQKFSEIGEVIEIVKNEIVKLPKGSSKERKKLEGRKKNLEDEKLMWGNCNIIFGLEEEIFDASKFPSCLITYATWNKLKYDVPENFQNDIGENISSWKVTEPLGFGTKENSEKKQCLNNFYGNQKLTTKIAPNILVFDDGGGNFRNDEKAWENLLYDHPENKQKRKKKKIDHIILKTAYSVGNGKLFQTLSTEFKDILTIIVSVNEIRKEDVLISKGVSWEQTALDLVYELKYNSSIKMLLDCKHLIVNLQSEGVFYLEMKDREIWKCRLIFDPEFLEGEWAEKHKILGNVIGSMTCITAAIAYGFMESVFNIESMITKALSAKRKYKIIGHGKDNSIPGFPMGEICNEVINAKSIFSSAFVPIPENKNPKPNIKNNIPRSTCEKDSVTSAFQNMNWTILEGDYKPAPNKELKPLFDTAFRFAINGEKELANTPFLKFKDLLTYDRREIESLRNIRNLIDDYNENDKGEKPLSLAVFGMPGSGKSFAVKQLSKYLKLPFKEFNLSQFVDVRELEGAFHQVRDLVLGEKDVPIIFWDEFDSQAYRWLQYLLAPMQDGKFQEGQITHPIGKCIFIFAGATSYTFETFGVNHYDEPGNKTSPVELKKYEANLAKDRDLILKKVPDFKSRLSGYLNIQGPNQLECLDKNGEIEKHKDGTVKLNLEDIFYPIRRALFIRGLAGKKGNEELIIDKGLLNALIKTTKFTHGSRSLEKIILHLKSKNDKQLQRSNLPSASVLSMVVNYSEFTQLLNEDKDLDFMAYKIAPEIHNNWIKLGDDQDWKLEYHKEYNYLPTHLKEENIAAAKRIPGILEFENLKIVSKEEKGFYNEIDFSKIQKSDTKLEQLAIEEHKGWVETKTKAGWRFNEERNDDRKQHNCIIGWNEKIIGIKKGENEITLSEKDKNKDKDAIINYPDVLSAAGFMIVEKK
ncbi:MAG: AAA family ATPase [Bacteroidetes bacterium]|nr:AAA family ATPase [Bacteroidota bacterium]